MASKKPALFYANAEKLNRARKVAKSPKDVLAEYKKLGGAFSEGHGVEEV